MHKTVKTFWDLIDSKNFEELNSIYSESAVIHLPNTREAFTVKNYIKFNSLYPGNWRVNHISDLNQRNKVITVVTVTDGESTHTCVAFFTLKDDLIIDQVEYWGENGEAPEWRKDLSYKEGQTWNL